MAKRKRNKHKRLHLAVLAGIASINAHAIGIGEIAVRSRLNEPLRADVPLIELRADDLDLARVRFQASGSDATGSTNSSIVAKLSGRFIAGKSGYVLEIRSQENIREPVVSFYVEVILPNAHARREFTVLLDPPELAMATKSAPSGDRYDFEAIQNSINTLSAAPGSKRNRDVRAPELTGPAGSSDQPAPEAQLTSKSKRSTPAVVAHPAPEQRGAEAEASEPSHETGTLNGDVYGPVKKNETLWAIARKVRPNRNVPILDTMQKLLAENPHAFVNNDINRLRVDVNLHVPALDAPAQAAGTATDNSAQASSTAASTATTEAASATSEKSNSNSQVVVADNASPATGNENTTQSTATAAPRASEAAATSGGNPTSATDAKANSSSATAPGDSSTVASTATSVAANTAAPQSVTDTAAAEQAAAMQARLDALAQRLEAVQRTLSEREARIANLEVTLDQLNTRLQNTQVQATPAAEPASTSNTEPSAATTATTPAASTSTAPIAPEAANYSGIRLPAGYWVWGMTAAVVAGLGAAFMARRRRHIPGVKHGLPMPVDIAAAPMPQRATASSIVAATDSRAEPIAPHGEVTIDEHIRTQIIAPPTAATSSQPPTTVDVDLHQPVALTQAVDDDGDGSAFATSPEGSIVWNDETIPNWSLERTIERTLEQTGETLAQSKTETFLQGGDEATVAATDATDDHKVVPLKLDSSRVEPVLKEVDLQMAYLQFEDAERLLMTPLQESPNEPSLLVKLAEVHVAAGNIDKFVDLAVRLSKIPEVRNSDDWKKIARMGEMVAPTHPLFEFVATVEITRDEFGNVATRA